MQIPKANQDWVKIPFNHFQKQNYRISQRQRNVYVRLVLLCGFLRIGFVRPRFALQCEHALLRTKCNDCHASECLCLPSLYAGLHVWWVCVGVCVCVVLYIVWYSSWYPAEVQESRFNKHTANSGLVFCCCSNAWNIAFRVGLLLLPVILIHSCMISESLQLVSCVLLFLLSF